MNHFLIYMMIGGILILGRVAFSQQPNTQQEVDQLGAEMNRIAKDTTFGGQSLLDGSMGTVKFQVGADANQTISFKLQSANGKASTGTTGFTISGIAAGLKFASASAVVASTGYAGSTTTIGSKVYKKSTLTAVSSVFVGGAAGKIDITKQSTAQAVLASVDQMLAGVDSKRAELGAVQNRMDSTIRNQSNVSENLSAARSRIKDADFATETANMTKQNILQQAASSVLAQANQRPQSALSLLK